MFVTRTKEIIKINAIIEKSTTTKKNIVTRKKGSKRKLQTISQKKYSMTDYLSKNVQAKIF